MFIHKTPPSALPYSKRKGGRDTFLPDVFKDPGCSTPSITDSLLTSSLRLCLKTVRSAREHFLVKVAGFLADCPRALTPSRNAASSDANNNPTEKYTTMVPRGFDVSLRFGGSFGILCFSMLCMSCGVHISFLTYSARSMFFRGVRHINDDGQEGCFTMCLMRGSFTYCALLFVSFVRFLAKSIVSFVDFE